MSAAARILIVDDEPNLRRALSISLRAQGYDVDSVGDGAAALQAVATLKPDAVVLDLGLPDMDGVEVLTRLRGWSNVPVVVLSARSDSNDKVRALDVGADDYVTKPFNIAELQARLRAVARRSTSETEAVKSVTLGAYRVDVEGRTVVATDSGENVHLTKTEWQLFELLARSPGRLMTHDALLRGMGRDPSFIDDSYLRLYIGQLRRKLEADHTRPRHILNEPGLGYRLVVPGS